MLQEMEKMYSQYLNEYVNMIQPFWFDMLKSEEFSRFSNLLRTYYFGIKEKQDEAMENGLDSLRIASKEDVHDIIDSQRVILDMLEEINDRIEKLEQAGKGRS
ncbi:MAG: hypothetical protein D6B26_05015 [Spirochaetaceae bacterium]|nr:MAG: hypothetical protein D6B26_05015 [Spirochaetaceae bacterium]